MRSVGDAISFVCDWDLSWRASRFGDRLSRGGEGGIILDDKERRQHNFVDKIYKHRDCMFRE